MIYSLTLHAAIDRVLRVSGFPEEDVMRSELVALLAAGKGFNVSRDLALLGATSVAAGLVGEVDADFYGRSFAELGVETLLEKYDRPTRTNITMLAVESGREAHLREKGAEVSPEIFDRLRLRLTARMGPGDVLAICGSLPAGLDVSHLESVLAGAHQRGATTLVDSSGAGLRFGPETSPRILKVNDAELAEFTGHSVEGVEEALEAAREALARGPELVLVTLGAEGALQVGSDGALHAKTPPVEAVNTVGAGDAFNAGFLWKRPEGNETALRYAAACGAAQAASAHIGTLDPGAVEELASGASLSRL